ncbi:radical SAM protein [Clostridium algidicarnis]|uniref:radical SAM protein n=1 Tax=Clostridium algidicarnis TaxID=37659 RepID=UPI001C0E41C5|nr:radical SAM protein [Clostridium algidicarnis]MBU3227075.1 radical SAM protein [Clostridium algidicarnis]MBU3250600.1 radical SAM protein [Clostridium algidicarnis]
MKIPKKDALMWFEFFAMLPEDQELMVKQQEIIYATFAQIEETIDHRNDILMSQIKGLKNLDNRTFFVGNDKKFSKGCRSCLFGTGLGAIRKTNKCDAQCKFCYNYGELDNLPPIGEGMWEIGGTKFYEKDIYLLLSIHKKPTGVAYVYLEPFMEIEKYYSVIKKFKTAGIYQHLYTNGISATEETLKALGEAGLDEIRFNLGATNCSDKVIENIKIAKKYIQNVGIETPMTPEFFEEFSKKKQVILDTKLDFINCAELHLNDNNIYNYSEENMYISRQGYISPIWSRELTLKLMKIADEENWDLAVHDCSNHTKFARDLNLSSKEERWFGASNYACEFSRIPYEAFLPILSDDSFKFLSEEELPSGYKPGELIF